MPNYDPNNEEADSLQRRLGNRSDRSPAKSRGSAAKPDSFASEKAQAARAARQAKMAGKQEDTTEAEAVETETAVSAPTPAIIAEHTVASGDTLSHIALKHYNSAARDKWMAIYEANKETIGENPSNIQIGQVLKIPQLND